MVQFLADLKRILGPAALRRLARQLVKNDTLPLAGQLAYFFVLFLFPFLIFMVSLAGTVLSDPEAVLINLLATRVEGLLPRELIEPVRDHLDRTLGGISSFTFIGSILFTLGVGSAAAQAIGNAANRAYGVPETRPFWKVRGVAILLIFAFMLLIAFLAFGLLSPQTGAYLRGAFGRDVFFGLWSFVSWAITFISISIALAVLYYLAPNAEVPFKWITPGGLVATALLLVSNQALKFFVANFSYDQFYGQLGSGIVLLVWLYVAGLVMLVGLEMNAVLARMAEERQDADVVGPREGS